MNRNTKNTKIFSKNQFVGEFAENKKSVKGGSKKIIFVVLFLLSGFFGFSISETYAAVFPIDTTSADALKCIASGGTGITLNGLGSCDCPSPLRRNASINACQTLEDYRVSTGEGSPVAAAYPETAGTASQGQELFDPESGIFLTALKMMLVGVQSLVIMLYTVATTLFAWVVNPDNISGDNGMLNKQAVKDVWIMVRDLLNMTFILVLLFAAFCTIFQVKQWNLKAVWLNILINALLVNFSYPIARFFIDISNVAFYYLVNNLFVQTGGNVTGSAIMAGFSEAAQISKILTPQNFATQSVAYQMAMIVTLFIMGMTLMIVAALFVVRLVALTMLVMFSPIGFVGYIFPSTAKYATDWWNSLFQYAFFAPIMIFIMGISLRIMTVMGNDSSNAFTAAATANVAGRDANWVASAAFFTIPVIMLWMGIGLAKKSGGAMASTIVDNVQKGGKWLANAPGKYSGVYGATKKAKEDFDKHGKLFGKKIPLMGSEGREAREAAMAGFVTGGAGGYRDARKNVEDKKIADKMKEYKDRNYTSDQIARDLDSSDKHKQMAATRALMAEKGALGADPDRLIKALNIAGNDVALRNKVIDSADDFAGNSSFTASHLNSVLNSATAGMATTDPARAAIEGKIKAKVKKENVKKLIDYEVNHLGKSHDAAYKDNLDTFNAKDLAEQKGLHENIGTDTHLQDYILNNVAGDVAFHQEVFKNMKKRNRDEYVNNSLHP